MGVEQTTQKILYPPGLRLGPSALLSFPSQSVESLAATNTRVRVAIAPKWSSRRNRLPSVFERRRLHLRRRKRHERGFQVVTHDSRKSYGTYTPFRESVLSRVIPHPLRFGKVLPVGIFCSPFFCQRSRGKHPRRFLGLPTTSFRLVLWYPRFVTKGR